MLILIRTTTNTNTNTNTNANIHNASNAYDDERNGSDRQPNK